MKNKSVLTFLAVIASGVSALAIPVTFNFQSNGSNLSLGNSSTFTVSGLSVTATANAGQSIYAKFTSGDPTETGLGITSDPTGNLEIYPSTFIQLNGNGGLVLDSILLSSVQAGETATIYYSTTLGVLGSLIATITADGSFTIPVADQGGYIGISAGSGNVLVESVTGHSVPDGGSTLLLLGSALTGLGLLKRKFMA